SGAAMGSGGSYPAATGEGESTYGSEYGSEYGGYGGMAGPGGRSLYGRYVDADGNPLPPTATQPFAEFKMMPVRMRLVVDQRKLDKLLVNCANSDMPIRIARVLIRPGQASLAGGMSPMGTMGSGYGSEGGSYSTGEGYGSEYSGAGYGAGSYGSGGYSPTGPGTTQGQAASNDVPVLIEGVIYIFNPPDFSMLGKEGGRELVSGQSLAPPETPATGTAGEQPGEAAAGTEQPAAAQPTGTEPATPVPQAPGAGSPPPAAGTPPGTPPGANPAGSPATPPGPGVPPAIPPGTGVPPAAGTAPGTPPGAVPPAAVPAAGVPPAAPPGAPAAAPAVPAPAAAVPATNVPAAPPAAPPPAAPAGNQP
ncbi:MAG: hypothetical protein GYA33_01425, partial [Thermogutta sp.]|nr:hypothetical protein [Thermogutta sp.]